MSTEPSQKQARLIPERGSSAEREILLSEFPVVVGRINTADIIIKHESISRQHARFVQVDDRITVEDLGSSNGTFVNGELVTRQRALINGDVISFGRGYRFKYELVEASVDTAVRDGDATLLETPDDATMQARSVGHEREHPPRLVVTLPGGETKEHPLTEPEITIGRAKDNDIELAYPLVSRRHAGLVRVGSDYVLHVFPDVTNPVRLHGQPVTTWRLSDGDELTIGRGSSEYTVKLRYEESLYGIKPDTPDTMLVTPSEAASELETRAVALAPTADAGPPKTIVAGDLFAGPKAHPQLVITVAGEAPKHYTLSGGKLTVGRSADNDIVISHPVVSRYHAQLEPGEGGYNVTPLPTATNPLSLDGDLIAGPTRLPNGAKLRIGGMNPGEMVTLVYSQPGEEALAEVSHEIKFGGKNKITIGRDEANDIVLNFPSISRFHAVVERVGGRFRIQDLRSLNGTFVDNRSIDGQAWLKPGETFRVGPYLFKLGDDGLAQYDESKGMHVEAIGLNKWVRKDLNILQDISLVCQRREFVVVVGQSGGGKSTLVDAIAGYRPATDGQVFVNGVDVYKEYDAIRSSIGFVPQKDIIHMQLTIYQALDYAAQLRMPPDTNKAERHKRVMEVLEDLDLVDRKDVQISGLSGGQQKRVSIGVELLTKPGLFFLDEPTSGLDPGTETSLMQLMRRLADQGRTIILITHATKNVMLADKVAFLARGGYLAWFGPPEEALTYFDQHRSERERRTGVIEFDEIYNLLGDPTKGSPSDWDQRYRNHPAYQQYIAQPLQTRLQSGPAIAAQTKRQRDHQASSLRQFRVLSARNLKILTRDRAGLVLMLMVTPLIALLDIVLAIGVGRSPYGFAEGNAQDVVVSLVVMVTNAILVAGLSQMRELVKEREIYRRERLVNLRITPYIFSKIWVAALLAVYQASIFVFVRYVAFDLPGGLEEIVLFFITMLLLSMAGMMLGLFGSALTPNANAVPLILILFLIPQIVLSGGLVPLPSTVTAPASSRWAFQANMVIFGVGSDVAADACWALSEEEQEALTAEDKAACNCMGVSALRQESCDFPGLGKLYDPAVDEVDPQEPPSLRDEPPFPEFPPEPEAPADPNDPAAMSAYLDALSSYNDEVDSLRQAYEADLAAYREEAERYQDQLADYQTELSELEVARASATGSAEASIRLFHDEFDWTFVDKRDALTYRGTVIVTWFAQAFIILLLLLGTILLQKRRDWG